MYEAVVDGVRITPTVESVFHKLGELKLERVDGIKRAAGNKLLEVAALALGKEKRLVIRDLLATDLGITNIEFADITGTDNTYTSILGGSKTMADNRFVCIWGVRLINYIATGGACLMPVITAVRFTVGGSYAALWDLYKLFCAAGAATAAGTSVWEPVAGITESPVIITQNISFDIMTNAVETTTVRLVVEGLVCEVEGKTLKP